MSHGCIIKLNLLKNGKGSAHPSNSNSGYDFCWFYGTKVCPLSQADQGITKIIISEGRGQMNYTHGLSILGTVGKSFSRFFFIAMLLRGGVKPVERRIL